mgnify:CR=1 FL=1
MMNSAKPSLQNENYATELHWSFWFGVTFFVLVIVAIFYELPLHFFYSLKMGRARKDIITEPSLVHITFRCHNREFYLDSDKIKYQIYKITIILIY